MNDAQEKLIRTLTRGRKVRQKLDAGRVVDWVIPEEIRAIAEVVLELVAIVENPPVIVSGEPFEPYTTHSRGTTLLLTDEIAPGDERFMLSHTASISIAPTAELPITAKELEQRGLDPELEARAIDVILRCGWPDRAKHRVNVEPCIPVPVSVMERWRNDPQHTAVWADIGRFLRDHERIQGLYVDALPDKPLPERDGT